MQEELRRLVLQSRSVAIIAHVTPDMDTLGASLGTAALLRQGFPALERVDLYCQDPVPAQYAFLPQTAAFKGPEQAEGSYDLCIGVDTAARDRLGACEPIFNGAKARFVIDHHLSNSFTDVPRLLKADSAAASQIVTELFDAYAVPIPKDAAECLFAGLSTDTYNFSYSSTGPDAFRAAAKLVEAGARPDWLTEHLYRTRSLGSVRALGRAMESLRLSCGGRVATMVLSAEDRETLGLQDGDYEGIVNYGLEVVGVLAAAFLTERPGGIRCSLRTREGVDAAALARRFGGGGHARAAGMSPEGSLTEAVEAVRTAVEKAVEEACRTDS